MARPMSPRQRAALRKAQLASARKRKGRGRSKTRRRVGKAALVAGAVAVAGGVAYSQRKKVKRGLRKKAENNKTVRTEVTKRLMAEARSKKRPSQKGLKMGKNYRMGRPDIRRKRKKAKGG